MALSSPRVLIPVSAAVVVAIAAIVVLPRLTTTTAPCAAPAGSAVTTAVFDGLPYRTDPGTPQHEDCRTVADDATTGFDFGTLDDPPTATKTPDHDVDVIAHFYNDFGLDSTLADAEWNGWYDWRWNFPTNATDADPDTEYDPARHPLLGFYKGDDPRALGWIAYWLASAGVDAVSITDQNGFTSAAWPGSSWDEQFLEHTPNADALDVVLALGNVGSTTEIDERAHSLLAWYAAHPESVYTVTEGGVEYAAVNVWDLEVLRGVFDDYEGSTNTRAFLEALAADFRAAGFGGIALQARNSGTLGAPDAAPMDGVVVISSTYEGVYEPAPGQTDHGDTYVGYLDGLDERYDAVVASTARTMLGVATSSLTQKPHPSDFSQTGSTPALFAENLRTTREYVEQHGLTPAISVYNVSEWAEGGPGLIPQRRDGFGYLEAVRSAMG